MGVIVELQIPAHEFEFGRRFPVHTGGSTELERVEPEGDGSGAIFSLSAPLGNQFDGRTDGTTNGGFRVELLEGLDGDELCVMEWDPEVDSFFSLLDDHGGRLRRGTGTEETWTFEARFPGHDAFSSFRSACAESNLSVDVTRVYNPTSHDTGAWFGLTPRQRRTLELAVERGYYDIPRRCTTIELADELGISDQAVTERLRRGIVTFVTNALLVDED